MSYIGKLSACVVFGRTEQKWVRCEIAELSVNVALEFVSSKFHAKLSL